MIVCLIMITMILNGANLDDVDYESNSNAHKTIGIFSMITTLTFVVFFAIGPGPVPWIVTGEFYTQPHR